MIEIAGRKIGAEFPPVVIAEIGINHEGSLEVAKEMVDAAFRAGVEIVKHQTHIVEDEMSGAAKKVIPGNADVSIYEIMERCSLNEQEEFQLKEYVESKGMIFISTPFLEPPPIDYTNGTSPPIKLVLENVTTIHY